MFSFFCFIGSLFARLCPERKECQQGLLVLFLKLQSWRGKKKTFSTCVRTFLKGLLKDRLCSDFSEELFSGYSGTARWIRFIPGSPATVWLTSSQQSMHAVFHFPVEPVQAYTYQFSKRTVRCHLNTGGWRWHNSVLRSLHSVFGHIKSIQNIGSVCV